MGIKERPALVVSSVKEKKKDETLLITKQAIHKSLAKQTIHRPQPMEKLEVIQLSKNKPEKHTYVDSQLLEEAKGEIDECLKVNMDIFTWTLTNMFGINLDVIYNHLNVDPQFKLVWKKKGSIAHDRLLALEEEIDKLLDVSFIRKVQYPNWLANVIIPHIFVRVSRISIEFKIPKNMLKW